MAVGFRAEKHGHSVFPFGRLRLRKARASRAFLSPGETTGCDPLQAAASATWQRQEALSPALCLQAMQADRRTNPDLVQVQSVLHQVAETGSLEAWLSHRRVLFTACSWGFSLVSRLTGGAPLAADT